MRLASFQRALVDGLNDIFALQQHLARAADFEKFKSADCGGDVEKANGIRASTYRARSDISMRSVPRHAEYLSD